MSILPYQFIDNLKLLRFVNAIHLFGSRARGDNAERSDIDIAIQMEQNSRQNWQQIMDNADTLLEIDCVNLSEADEMLRQRIIEQGTILYERTPAR